MFFLSSVRVALASLVAHKMRSFLAVLGIVIGVAAVIVMVSMVKGTKAQVDLAFERMGTNLVFVSPNWRRRGHSRARTAEAESLTPEDLDALKRIPHVKVACPEVRDGAQVKYMNENTRARITGTTPEYLVCRNFEVERGRFFTHTAVRNRLTECALGARIAEQLFGEVEPLGRQIQIERKTFDVVGVLKDKGGDTWGDLDETVYIPVTTAMFRVFNQRTYSQLTVSVDDPENVPSVKKAVDETIRRRHNIPPGTDEDETDFRVRAMDDYRKHYTQTTDVLMYLLGGAAAVSLVVGGIGIMNIMLVSVTERTREIGIRKAIGARRGDIMRQFLIESVTISLMGGILGIVIGVALSELFPALTVSRRMDDEGQAAVLSIEAILFSFAFSCAVGIFFGIYPAHKASRLNPVEALRYE